MPTFFASLDPKFQPVPADGDVRAGPFLQAALKMLPVFEMLGTAFKPIKSDIEGNINMLQKKYDQDPEQFQTFHAMLDEEIASGTTKKKGSAAISLLWLMRALNFTSRFLQYLMDDHRCGAKTENMAALIKKSYEETLKAYHGWIIQKVFSVVVHAVPWRRDFLKTLALGEDGQEDQVINEMGDFVKPLSDNIVVIHELLVKLGLDSKDKV